MSVRDRLQRVNADDDAGTIAELARDALAQGEEDLAVPTVHAAAARQGDARLWQYAGLLYRALDEHERALECFASAARLAPDDASIAHGRAHVALEAGVDAEALFERARSLAPDNGAVLIGMTAARMAAGHGIVAAADLERVLEAAPLWVEGHMQLAQLRSMLGQPAAVASLERAIARQPREEGLWVALCDLALRRAAYDELRELVERGGAAGANLGFYRAVAAGEMKDPLADRLLSDDAVAASPALAVWRIRHLLRHGRAAESLLLIDRELGSERGAATWPYAAIAWRLAGDPRRAWLEDAPGTVAAIDLSKQLAPLGPVVDRLRALHARSGQFLDQSVRGGTQTDGPLFSRIEPEIRTLRATVVRAVEQYRANLPRPDPSHPLLGPQRQHRLRFSGSWSVRLKGRGHHANHVHPLGWISSALHLAVPRRRDGDPSDSGWLILGQPDAGLGVDLPPQAAIAPKEGQLVLFPSWMWHGTRPFAEGERLTVAFDVAHPR